ncbi:A16L1-like protein, partial [Mya arenaria]
TLKDEHQALQMAFTSLEEKFRKLQSDNDELMARWLQQKMEQAEVLNRENDNFIKHRQLLLQKELAEAAKENVNVPEGDENIRGIPQICLSASIPTKAQCKLCSCKGMLTGSNAGITSLEYDLDESHILGASNDYACRLWSIADQRLRHTLTGHSGKVLSAKFLGENSKVVSGSHDRTLKIWDLHTKAFTLHGTHIISGHFDKRVRFWDTKSDNTSNEIGLHGRITSLALSPDRTSLLVCTREDTLKVIDLRQNQVIYTLCDDNFKVGYDWSRAVFSPDGTYACAGSSDGTLFIWNIARGKVEKTLKEHTHSILACSWHPAGSYILSSEKQKKVVLWSDI